MQNSGISPKVPAAGIVYGHITYWLVLLSLAVALAGVIISLVSDVNCNNVNIVSSLWEGDNVHLLWAKCADLDESLHGYWYLYALPMGDEIAMLGIVISCIASVIGMWGASAALLYNPEHSRVPARRLYFIFASIVTVILTLSASGILRLY